MADNPNRTHLDTLKQSFEKWLHVEDPRLLYTLAATKITHRLEGDPVWLMIIGPSSGGKSEYLRAFTQEDEITLDDMTSNTFISGYKGTSDDKKIPQFGAKLKDKIWYIYDLSILMSKNADERSKILSQLRMIYDGKLSKPYGNKQEVSIDTYKNTLICGSTNAIDNTILEDQALGTRFIHYRIPKSNRWAMMEKIDETMGKIEFMREDLNHAVRVFENSIDLKPYYLTENDLNNLQIMCNLSTLLRTSVSFDKSGEPSNLAYPEEPGRFYKEIQKIYQGLRTIGLDETESYEIIRKICIDNINPIRVKVLGTIYKEMRGGNGWAPEYLTTTNIHTRTGLGKKSVKMHMHTLNLLELVDYSVEEDQWGKITRDKWSLRRSNLNLLFDEKMAFKYGKTLYPLYRKGVGG